MAVNKSLAIAGCLITGLLAGWMLMEAESVSSSANADATPQTKAVSAQGKTEDAQEIEIHMAVSPKQNKDSKHDPRLVIAQENLSLLYIVKCSACHGRDGKGPVGRSIAGKSYEYNLEKLQLYKANKVENTMMEDMLTRTSDEELKMLSREISAFK